MIRLLLVLGLAGVLWPVDENSEMLSVSGIEITSGDVFSAAQSIYSDIGGFCERNVETCITGQQIYATASSNIQARLEGFSSGNQTVNAKQ
ncbi:MAG: DUF5330 domain-containing protein [Pseudomonadota bacterium]